MAGSDFWSSFLRPLCEEKQYELLSEVDESEPTSGDDDSEYQPSEGGSDPEPKKKCSLPDTRKVACATKDKSNQQQVDSHRGDSASGWTVKKHLATLIKRGQVALVTLLCHPELPNRTSLPGFKEDLINCSKQILDKNRQFSEDPEDGLKLRELPSWDINEATISILVQRMLGSVCQSVEVIMKPELTLQKDKKFGAAKVDFALFYERFCVGVVEIKTPKTLGPDSVAQLVLPLMKLRLKNEDSKVAYLGILTEVTDGFRYVFVKHQGDKFIFENAETFVDPSINIHKPLKWDDLDELQKYVRKILGEILNP